MSLKTDYFDGANGFNTKMLDVFDAGVAFVTSSSSALTTGLQAAAAQGEKKFTVNIITTFEPANLRLNGDHQRTFFAGILNELGTQDVYNYEVSLSLNTSDQTTTSVDFNFTF